MIIRSVSIRSVDFGTSAEASAEGAAFRTVMTSSVSGTDSVAGWASEGPDWLRVYRPFMTGPARYFVRAEATGSAISSRDAETAVTAMTRGALGVIVAGEGVTITSFSAGYYSDASHEEDGLMDILLNFSDGTHALIQTVSDESDDAASATLVMPSMATTGSGPPPMSSPGGPQRPSPSGGSRAASINPHSADGPPPPRAEDGSQIESATQTTPPPPVGEGGAQIDGSSGAGSEVPDVPDDYERSHEEIFGI